LPYSDAETIHVQQARRRSLVLCTLDDEANSRWPLARPEARHQAPDLALRVRVACADAVIDSDGRHHSQRPFFSLEASTQNEL
jgi:hypothetical protein